MIYLNAKENDRVNFILINVIIRFFNFLCTKMKCEIWNCLCFVTIIRIDNITNDHKRIMIDYLVYLMLHQEN